jgi:hypothetical protein
MWVFTTHGFYSIVSTSDDHSVVLVRTRDRKSLEKLIDFLNENDNHVGKYGDDNIIVTPYRDYPYRIAALRDDWVHYLERYAYEKMLYPNFKSACKAAGMSRRQLLALGDVWGTMYHDWADRPEEGVLEDSWV